MAEIKWATDERRLGPAYDDILAGRLKSASAIVERHLKKHPKSQPALVLRTVILERSESAETAILEAWGAVKKTGDLTTRSAWLIGTTFRNLGRRDLTLEIYQSQWANQPDSVELGEQVFLHAAAAWDRDTMVESSRKMFNKLKAPVWARVAAWSEWVKNVSQPVSQDSFTPSSSNNLRVSSTLLSLAQKNCESADILWLHLQILVSAGHLTDALSLAQSAATEGSLARMWYRMEGVKEILSRMEQRGEDTTAGWTAEWEWAKGRLGDPECRRNYAFYRQFLRATSHPANASIPSETLETLEAVHAEIGEKERAPRLAILELDQTLKQTNHSTTMSIEDWSGKAMEYWERWGSKGSVVTEMEGVVGEDEAKAEALVKILGNVTASHETPDEYRRVVNKELLLLRTRAASWTADEAYLRSLSKLYNDGLRYGRNLPKSDVQPADDIGLALVHLLVVQWARSSTDTPPYRAILILRVIINHSPACKSASLLLGRLLRLVGASSIQECTVGYAAKEWSEIQLDNLAHFSHDRAGVEAHVNGTEDGWEKYEAAASKMYKRTAADMPDYIKQALQHESYSKIPSIRTLASTSEHSSSRHLMAVEQSRLKLVSGKSLSPATLLLLRGVVQADDLVDTQDWSLLPDLGRKRRNLREAIALGDEPSRGWIKAWAGVLLRVGGLEPGKEMGIGVDLSELLPVERAMLSMVLSVAERVDAALRTNGIDSSQTEVGGFEAQLKGFVEIIKNTGTASPWLRLYHCYLLIELKSLISQLRSRIDTASKPAGKKASKLSPAVADLLKEVQELQGSLREQSEQLVPGLEEMRATAEKVDWKGIRELDDLPEGESLIAFGKTVTEARVSSIDSIKKHLKS